MYLKNFYIGAVMKLLNFRLCNYLILLVLLVNFLPTPVIAGSDLDAIKARDKLLCGGGYTDNFNKDLCSAIAAATLGDANKVDGIRLTVNRRFEALSENAIDVIVQSVTLTLGRDAGLGLSFVGPVFYDGQGFIAPRKLGITKLSDTRNTTVCVQKRSTSLDNIVNYAEKHPGSIIPMVFESPEVMASSFLSEKCALYSDDKTNLLGFISREEIRTNSDFVMLDDTISKEPLTITLREGDDEWRDIVQWTFYALVQAEELGITSKNAAEKRVSGTPSERKFLGAIPGIGKPLGLDDGWVFNIISQVGNYGEIFDRHLGSDSQFKLKRGLNDLWTRGGLLYSPPFNH